MKLATPNYFMYIKRILINKMSGFSNEMNGLEAKDRI